MPRACLAGAALLLAAALLGAADAQWAECDNFNSIKGGSCNGPTIPCEPGSGCTNAGKTDDIFACESLCEKHPNCSALTWHDAHAGGWANVCVLQTEAAFHLEKQGDHHAACLKSAAFPTCSCGTAPAPAPSPGPVGTDACVVARTAYAKADAALGGRGNAAVFASLDAWMDFGKCPNATAPVPDKTPTGLVGAARWEAAAAAGAAMTFFVSPIGSDSNSGTTESSPFKTLQKAQAELRALPAAQRAGSVVNLLAGTHELSSSLVFTPSDSGAPGAPVTWQAYPPGAAVAVSGGASLACDWQPTAVPSGAAGVFKCALPAGAPASFDELFVDGLRQVRARFPNGDPLVPHDGYTSGAQAKSRGTFPNTAVPACQTPNLQVTSSVTGSKVAAGCVPDMPTGWTGTVAVADISGPRGTVTTATAYANSSRFNDTFNLPMWNTVSTSAITLPKDWAARKWAPADVTAGPAVVKMMHPSAWGSWAFQVGEYDAAQGITFAKGGNQEARGSSGVGDMYIENVFPELDAPGEFYLDAASSTLYFMPAANTTLSSATRTEVSVLPRLVQFRGDAAGDVVHDIALVGFNVSRAAPTYLMDYEDPSGGDWSIHRGGAVFLDGAEAVSLRHLVFDQVGGNGVFLSNHAARNAVVDCDFWRTGDTAVAAVGSTHGMNGTADTFPTLNTVARNHFDTVGVYMKQTSCYFKAQTYANNITANVCHDGPRAGVNFNDGFRGGDNLQGNVIWAMVRETGDHGTFNSWDRKEYIYPCPPASGQPAGSTCFMPQTHQVHQNMFIGPAGWNMDHDDGSSEYHDYSNIVYQGGFKYRDGINRNMTGNLMVHGAVPVFQVFGFATDYFEGNYLWGQTKPLCGPNDIGGLSGNVFIPAIGTDGEAALGDNDVGERDARDVAAEVEDAWYNAGAAPLRGERQRHARFGVALGDKCDSGKVEQMTLAQVEALARKVVGL